MAPNPQPTQIMQGIEVPASSVDPGNFFRLTRRLTVTQKTFNFAGLGLTDNVPILQTGIISGLMIKFSGSLTVTLAGGTAASTMRWPYDLIKAARFSANGQSNLINVSGAKLKARELMARGDLSDRGVTNGIGGASPGTSRSQGTMALSTESWGVGQNVTAIPGAPTVYPVELEWYVPIAFDDWSLTGAIFAQTSATDLNLAIDWAPIADLFVTTAAATVTLSGATTVQAKLYTIPQGPNGSVIVPDLSTFHSLIQTRYATPSNGLNEVRLSGQGVGKQLMRLYWQLWNGSGAGAPLPVNATNFSQIGWRFGGNDTPEVYPDGRTHSYSVEKTFGSDLCTYQGFSVLDFASEHAFRDAIDEGTATELRFLCEVPQAVTLTSPYIEYVQETLSLGAAA